MKECNKCGETKELSEFHKDKECRLGVKNACKECKIKQKNAWYAKNAERQSKKARVYRKKNKDKTRAARKKWDLANVPAVRAKEAKRRAAKLNRTPNWLSQEQLEDIRAEYAMAKKLEAITGDVYHVDHIVPLQGENVSGLHVPWNLQVIEASENLRKHNKWN